MRYPFSFLIRLSLLSLILTSCNYDPDEFHGELQSDGYLQYKVSGVNVSILDSIKAGDPSFFLLNGYYFRQESVLQLEAVSLASNDRLRIYLLHCKDTGLFSLGATGASSAQLEGWITDSLHTGQVHLTRLDTLKDKVAGTFYFQAVNKDLSPDSVFVDSGSFVDYPITLAQ